MKTVPRIFAVSAAMTITLLGLTPATQAAKYSPIPSDCNLSQVDPYTVSLTCTKRPATQQWQVYVYCGEEFPMVEAAQGNIVTGNGTSTATCPNYPSRTSAHRIVK